MTSTLISSRFFRLLARRAQGSGLFSSRKPPKTSNDDTDNTHFCRTRVQYAKNMMWSLRAAPNSRWCAMRSFDAKCAIRCGTDVGLSKTRSHGILLPTSAAARALPKHDFPSSVKYITPASHKLIVKRGVLIDGSERLVTDNDSDIVFVRPKAVIPDTATTWANETMVLVHSRPEDFAIVNPDTPRVWFVFMWFLLTFFLVVELDFASFESTALAFVPHRFFQ